MSAVCDNTGKTPSIEANAEERVAETVPQDLFRFFLLESPHAKSDKSLASSALSRDLSDSGWEGAELHKLMQWVSLYFLTTKGELMLSFKASDSVNETIRDFGLDVNNSSIPDPRAVLQINNKITVSEKGQCKMKLKETYATCLFRHIRNSFAHGNFRTDENGRILMLDFSSKPKTDNDKKKYTFGMSASISFLRELMKICKKKPNQVLTNDDLKRLNNTSYRLTLEKEISIDSPGAPC